ncbi:MAG: hypothetical protein WD032_11255 [Nitrospirales bacterium]
MSQEILGHPPKRDIFRIDKVRLHPRMVKAEGMMQETNGSFYALLIF